MRRRSVRRPWRATAVASLLVVGVGCLAGCSAGRAARDPTSPPDQSTAARPTNGPGGTRVRVLQMNLCNSGRAGCYSGGRAIARAEALIRDRQPDIVTLNEVCRGDVHDLEQAMSAAADGGAVASAFKAAQDRPTQAPVRCRSGQEFGDGVVALAPDAARGIRTHSGLYPVQDPRDVEERVWVCLDLAARLSACTTHAASTDTTVALAQCRYLLGSVVPTLAPRDSGDAVIVGADLNIAAGGSPSVQSCLPRGYQRADDGALQYVVASAGLAVGARSVIDMQGSTDHPALLVDLVVSR